MRIIVCTIWWIATPFAADNKSVHWPLMTGLLVQYVHDWVRCASTQLPLCSLFLGWLIPSAYDASFLYCKLVITSSPSIAERLFHFRSVASVVHYVKRSLLLLVTSVSDSPLRISKLSSVLFSSFWLSMLQAVTNKYSRMRRHPCSKLHGQPSQLLFALHQSLILSQLCLENGDFCLLYCIWRPL